MSYKTKATNLPSQIDGLHFSCHKCGQTTSREILAVHGAMCYPCYASYCRQAPAYMPELEKYRGDPKAWAKRIMDRKKAGVLVSAYALACAKTALYIKDELTEGA